MFLKKRIIATAAVIAMAAAAVFGSTQEMSQTQDTGDRLQLFRGKETIYCWYSDESLSGYTMRQRCLSENRIRSV